MPETSEDEVDFAVAAYREEGRWQVVALPPRAALDIETLLHALRQSPGEFGTLGMVSIDEDFFVLARVHGDNVRLLLSDVTAATESPLAAAVVDELDLPMPEEDDEVQPAGEIGILSDLGVSAMDLAVLCDDDDLYPDEMLEDIASQIGFADEYAAALGTG
ncbi:MAG TPA: tRNA adenosine deaminase-associated protein [Nocardioidaceae bacterium]|nr:tRNA adenosine deaminase-associated protein [Nocardioidaceae bacterium]